jgi:uncharacterized protein YaiE (UPF0345 family)
MKIKFLIIFLLFSFTFQVKAQNEKQKWTAGVSLAAAKYMTDFQASALGGGFVYQTPRFNISRYLFSNITFDASISTAIFDSQTYTTFDGVARYDFGTSENNVVPYILLGGSFIKAKVLTPTVNFGVGNTFWFSQKYGFNLQVMYKYSDLQHESQFSHVYTSIGLVYSFSNRTLNPRLWED